MNVLTSTGAWLSNGGSQTLSLVVLIALLIGAAWIDVREHRIPNALVFPGVVVALLISHLPGGSVSSSLIGIAVGFGMSLPLYWLRAMGAGDVKLMGMVGSFLGGADMFIATLVIFIVGGVLSLFHVARKRAFMQLGANVKQMAFGSIVNAASGVRPQAVAPYKSVGVQPYGVAIAAGTILYLTVLKGGLFG